MRWTEGETVTRSWRIIASNSAKLLHFAHGERMSSKFFCNKAVESVPELQKFLRFLQNLTFCGSMFALCKDTLQYIFKLPISM